MNYLALPVKVDFENPITASILHFLLHEAACLLSSEMVLCRKRQNLKTVIANKQET